MDRPRHPHPKPDAERTLILDDAIRRELLNANHRVEHRSDFHAVIVQGKPVNHILHLLLTVFTLGLWAIVWIILALNGGERRTTIEVDEAGRLHTRDRTI